MPVVRIFNSGGDTTISFHEDGSITRLPGTGVSACLYASLSSSTEYFLQLKIFLNVNKEKNISSQDLLVSRYKQLTSDRVDWGLNENASTQELHNIEKKRQCTLEVNNTQYGYF